MIKIFYEKFWYPVLGNILSKFVFLIEGSENKNLKKSANKKKRNKDKY